MAAPQGGSQPAGAAGSKIAPASSEDSLWNVDFEKADLRISQRRNRIKNRISASRKIRKMIQIKHMFGYHSTENRETFPVEAQCDARSVNFRMTFCCLKFSKKTTQKFDEFLP